MIHDITKDLEKEYESGQRLFLVAMALFILTVATAITTIRFTS